MKRPQLTMTTTQVVVNSVLLAVLVGLALVPLYSAFLSSDFIVAAVGGILVGTVLAVLGAMFRWGVMTVAALTVVAYFLFGGMFVFSSQAILGFIPTLDVLSSLAVGTVYVWKDLLTLQAPFASYLGLGVAPYILGLVGSVIAVSLGLRLRRPAWALLPVAALMVLSIAFSTYRAFYPALSAAAATAVALGWLVWRSRIERRTQTAVAPDAGGPGPRRSWGVAAVAASVVVLVAGGVGAAGASAVSGSERDVLRDRVVPPLEVRDYASPLSSFRRYTVTDKTVPLFTVKGLPGGARIRLAALDMYDGVVYKVSGAGGAGSGQFNLVGREVPTDVKGSPVTVKVTMGDLGGIWVPTAGAVTSITAAGALSQIWPQTLHYNTASQTAVVTSGLAPGDSYTFSAVIPALPSAKQLARAQAAAITTPPPAQAPTEISDLIQTATTPEQSPIEQVLAVAQYLKEKGKFSRGDGDFPSPSGHYVQRLSTAIGGDQMVGDDEQYAVSLALAAAQIGVPVRVVVGFISQADQTTSTITGAQAHAWVEIPVEGFGWVPIDATPPQDRVPSAEVPQKPQKPSAQVAQPPPVPQAPPELPPAPPIQEAAPGGNKPAQSSWLWPTLQIGGGVLLAVAVLLFPSMVLALLRLRRRRRRARALATPDRVGGAWAEVVDRATDTGLMVSPAGTRREQATQIGELYPEVGAIALANRADRAVFGEGEPTQADVDAYWEDVLTAVKRVGQDAPWYQRLRAALFPRSVLRRPRTTVSEGTNP